MSALSASSRSLISSIATRAASGRSFFVGYSRAASKRVSEASREVAGAGRRGGRVVVGIHDSCGEDEDPAPGGARGLQPETVVRSTGLQSTTIPVLPGHLR